MKKFIAILLVMLSSCTISYKFNGASIDYNKIKTISVSDFPIKAALVYPPLSQVFTDALKNIYIQQTRLNMVKNNGDLQVEGEITRYDLSPQAVTENGLCIPNQTHHRSKSPLYQYERTSIRPGSGIYCLPGLFQYADANRCTG